MEGKDVKLDAISAAEAAKFYEEYLEYLEETWRKSGKTRYGLFSVMDCDFLTAWEEAGIPPTVIVTGVERTLAKHHGPRPINSISYCEPEIYRAWEEFMERRR